MYSFVALCLIFGLATLRAGAYVCNDTDDYPNLAKGWKEVVDQDCDKLNYTHYDAIAKCINDTKIPLMDAINHCQKEFKQKKITFVGFIKKICQSNDDMEYYFCCLTDYVLRAGADKQSVERSAVYTKCSDKYFRKSN